MEQEAQDDGFGKKIISTLLWAAAFAAVACIAGAAVAMFAPGLVAPIVPGIVGWAAAAKMSVTAAGANTAAIHLAQAAFNSAVAQAGAICAGIGAAAGVLIGGVKEFVFGGSDVEQRDFSNNTAIDDRIKTGKEKYLEEYEGRDINPNAKNQNFAARTRPQEVGKSY